ncbi:cytochrome P450 [Mycena sp. CBHHK59/15]|nr:cytochrome P450 [Mycena sp. CBHHK59/15]
MVYSLAVLPLALTILGIVVLRYLTRTRRAPLPPTGPRPILEILALSSGSDEEWLTYSEWADRWGDITSVTVFGQPLIVLSSLRVATEILDKQSSFYSDRPVLQMCGKLVGWKKRLGLSQYGSPLFKFGNTSINCWAARPAWLGSKWMRPRDFYGASLYLGMIFVLTFGISAAVLRITSGYTVEGTDDPLLVCFFAALAPGAFWVDLIPVLKYVPSWMLGPDFQRTARTWAKDRMDMTDKPLKSVQDKMTAAASIYGGGTDATVAVVSIFFLVMTLYPEVQAQAQLEIDTVVGNLRLPTYADRDNLPYVEAPCKKVQSQLYKVILLSSFQGFPLSSYSSDGLAASQYARRLFYSERPVPSKVIIHAYPYPLLGSIVFTNLWKITHDVEVYRNPMVFDPSRFFASDSHVPEPDPREIVFGFGRRVCLGLHFPSIDSASPDPRTSGKLLADASVFLMCAMTLAAFKISKAVNGIVIKTPEDFSPGTPSSSPLVTQTKTLFSHIELSSQREFRFGRPGCIFIPIYKSVDPSSCIFRSVVSSWFPSPELSKHHRAHPSTQDAYGTTALQWPAQFFGQNLHAFACQKEPGRGDLHSDRFKGPAARLDLRPFHMHTATSEL